jgi:SAM-dependent methyltransferase
MGSSEVQGMLWGAAAQDWAELFEPTGRPLWAAMLDSAEVGQGTRVLDLGCGGGGASVLAAKRGARVEGLDAAAALIEIARERVPDAGFRVGDLEQLPYKDDGFDVAFASLSIMFASHPLAALREMERATVPGGRVTVGIWGKPEDCDYRQVLKAVADTLPSPLRGEGPFALSGTGRLEAMMESVGLQVLDSGEVDAPFRFSNSESMWREISSAGPVQSARQVVSERELKVAIARAAEPFEIETGEILLNNRFRYVTAIVPSRSANRHRAA